MFVSFTSFILTIILLGIECEGCTDYGCPLGPPIYEPFLPAAPGNTPHCAQPGQTFCENLDHYPQQLINFLVEKCTFDFKTILKDESSDDFNSYRKVPNYKRGYEYNRPSQGFSQNLPSLKEHQFRQPALVYGAPFNSTYQTRTHQTEPNRNPFILPTENRQQQFRQKSEITSNKYFQPLDPLNFSQSFWINRFTRENDMDLLSRTRRKNPLLEFVNNKNVQRKKRQDNNAISICPTTTKFVYPRAALNNQGNWMYIVNTEEITKKHSQIIRSEVCETETCNELCTLPIGYTSRCAQQYVQKRLVALEGSGDRLYTDIFWFPHGCMCQVVAEF